MKKVALYNPYLSTKGGGEKVSLALAGSLQHDMGCSVYLVSSTPVDVDDLAQYFKLDLSGIKVLLVDYDTFFLRIVSRLPLPGRIRNIFLDRCVMTTIRRNKFDLFINNCYQSNLPSPLKSDRSVYMCMFPQRLQGAAPDVSLLRRIYTWTSLRLNRLILHPSHKTPIDTYQIITANSAYTQSFIQSMWHRDSSILYPICEDMHLEKVKKEKIILHVGRFFADNGESHYKCHDKMLDTFAGMTDLHKQGWQLHFAGSVAEDVDALKYILQLLKSAESLPVFFHFNSPFKELRELFNRASIYWHATGYGSDAALHPEKQEHFGITTVEAMSTGAVPIVINSAGQKESVQDGVNGYLWDTLNQLAKDTRLVVSLPVKDYTALSHRTAKSARRYDAKAFRHNVTEIFTPIVSD